MDTDTQGYEQGHGSKHFLECPNASQSGTGMEKKKLMMMEPVQYWNEAA
jgi:hypothetical protein